MHTPAQPQLRGPHDNLATAYAALMRATLAISGELLDEIPPNLRPAVDGALAGGARLVLESELPDCGEVTLWLVEREGRRHRLHSVSAARGRTQ